MSFELFLQCFAGGQPSGVPGAAIRAAFGSALSEPEEDFWQVHYATESSDLFLSPLPSDPGLVHTLAVYRPCEAPGLHEALWQLLELPGTCLHFPGAPAPLSRDPAIVAAMPADMLLALGHPALVESPAAIAGSVREAMS